MHKPDGLVGDDVREALDWDNAIDDARIMVQVKDGKVTLSGAVHTYTEALKALEDTKHVKGVRDIDNQLLVGPAGEAVTDAVLLEACEKALDGNPFVPKGAVSVAVRDGWVTLTGDVRHHYQRDAAEDAVSLAAGRDGDHERAQDDPEPDPLRRRRPDQQGDRPQLHPGRLGDQGLQPGQHGLFGRRGQLVLRPGDGRGRRVERPRCRGGRRPAARHLLSRRRHTGLVSCDHRGSRDR